MDISQASSIFGMVIGVTLCVGWVWKLRLGFQKQLVDVRESAKQDGEFVMALLSQATTPLRRADIHAYVQFRCAEIESNRSQNALLTLATGCFAVTAGLLMAVFQRVLGVDAAPWLLWSLPVLLALLLCAFGLALFYSGLVKTVQAKWLQSAKEVLHQRAVLPVYMQVDET